MRINVVPVQLLSDVHLRAEYREILMAPHYYRKSSKSEGGIKRELISDVYILNKGHAMMWYDKMGYIKDRHDDLEKEMIIRGFKIREQYSLDLSFIPAADKKGYKPSIKDYKVNIERILLRIKDKYDKGKDTFYKHYGKNVTIEYWKSLYGNLLKKS